MPAIPKRGNYSAAVFRTPKWRHVALGTLNFHIDSGRQGRARTALIFNRCGAMITKI
jgi:hypothetical protein